MQADQYIQYTAERHVGTGGLGDQELEPSPDGTPPGFFDEALYRGLTEMYIHGGVERLVAGQSPELREWAALVADAEPSQDDRPGPIMNDTEQAPDEEELLQAVMRECRRTNNLLVRHSARMLAGAIIAMDGRATGSPTERQLRQKIAGSIREASGTLQEAIEPHVVSARVTKAGDLYVVEQSESSPAPVPQWLSDKDRLTESMDRFLHQRALETDCFLAVLEWVRVRRLPYVPVMSPSWAESGEINPQVRNVNSDIILCSVLTPDLCPVQVKRDFTWSTRRRYFEDMRFIGTEELGVVRRLGPKLVEHPQGRKRYDTEVTETDYGAVSAAWLELNQTRRHRPDDALAVLRPAFEYLDQAVYPKLEAA